VSSRSVDLVITDLDGTLWTSEGEILPVVLDAWRQIERAGLGILVATGRRLASTRALLEVHGLAPPAVLLDGAIGVALENGERFHERSISRVAATEILGLFIDLGLSPVVYVDSPETDVFVSDHPSTHPGHLALFGDDASVADLETVVRTERVLAFGLVGVDRGAAEAIERAVVAAGCAEARVNPSFDFGGCSLTVVGRGISKWDGILAFCAANGLDPARTLAIGDGSNDVEMLTNAGLSFSLVGSSDRALAAASHVVGPAISGGWAEILAYL
jgi:hydroxymethylpyrimidine pyrophosphatase-like HAD family hydrolase